MPKVAAFVLAATFAVATVLPALARPGDRVGDFDFWVLSLSWSPSFCEATGDALGDVQCSRPFAFVVHGLWPQRHRGYPADCVVRAAEPSRAEIAGVLDVMPSPGLVRHEWRRHGTCSGLAASAYLTVIRRLFEKIHIPADYRSPREPRVVATRDVERDFMTANPGLDASEISIFCDTRRLREVRICLKKDLSGFTSCPELERRDCRADRIYMPAVR